MNGNALRILLLTIVSVVAGCGPAKDVADTPLLAEDSEMASCPADLIDYCGIWDVVFASSILKDKHMDIGDRFKIDVNSSGTDPDLWLFAGTDLEGRWIGKEKFKLAELTSGGAHDCLAGEIRLTPHDQDGTSHEWHQVTVRTEEIPSPDFGTETRLEVCFTKRENGSPSTACEIAGCAEDDDDILHGGRVHSQD